MESFSLYNSKTKTVEELHPLSGTDKVTVYNCGPTVYKRQHIGNMRRFLTADTLKRTLELLGYTVKDVTNITDVGHLTQDEIDAGEDKLEKEAKATARTPQDIAKEQTELFFSDIDALNIERSSLYPAATEHVQDMISLIETLIKKGHAYVAKSGVYYDVSSFPAYGALSGNTVASLNAGHRVEIQQDKKDPADFALWMIDDSHLQSWDSPWGKGYPGWHIECSAMSMKYLGQSLDIHTGGEDNRFPHHENEIAQSEGATGKPFVQIWMHNRHLLLNGKKMAKREGESITIDTLQDRGYSPLAFRLLVFAHHYRSPIDFSWELLDEYKEHVNTIKRLLERNKSPFSKPLSTTENINPHTNLEEFKSALADDLNTSKAFALFLQTIRELNRKLDQHEDEIETHPLVLALEQMDTVIGVFKLLTKDVFEISDVIKRLAKEREQAKADKNYAKADMLRAKIEEEGFLIQDMPEGPKISKK